MVDLAGLDQTIALVAAERDAVPLPSSSAKPVMVRGFARRTQVRFTKLWPRPLEYALSRTFETTPSKPSLQTRVNVSAPSISKLSLYCTSVPAMIFLSSAFRRRSGSFRLSRPFR